MAQEGLTSNLQGVFNEALRKNLAAASPAKLLRPEARWQT
jgi:hypothetical protein